MEAELATKERELGGNHAAVADTLSNIAILYNQRGEADKALPMYERALAIYEKARGPKSQDVAHTLTDLAVLHLEAQVRLQLLPGMSERCPASVFSGVVSESSQMACITRALFCCDLVQMHDQCNGAYREPPGMRAAR
jgi:tetratricopeptide (TPR) repeat protein